MNNAERQQIIENRNKLESNYKKLDSVIEWMLENNSDNPKWQSMVDNYHVINNRIAVLEEQKKEFSGIDCITITQMRT